MVASFYVGGFLFLGALSWVVRGFTASSSPAVGLVDGWAGSLAWIGSQMVSWVVGDNWAACGVRLRIGSWLDAGFGVDLF